MEAEGAVVGGMVGGLTPAEKRVARYLVNGLRETFDMPGVPIRLSLTTSENPFAGRAKKKK